MKLLSMVGVEEQVSIGVGCRFSQLASTNGIKVEKYPLDYITNRLSMSGLGQTLSLLTQNQSFVNSKFACSNLSLLPHLFFQKAELVIICKQHYPDMNTSLKMDIQTLFLGSD